LALDRAAAIDGFVERFILVIVSMVAEHTMVAPCPDRARRYAELFGDLGL